MSVVSERSSEKLNTHLRLRPVALATSDSFALALLCSTSNEYYYAVWDEQYLEWSAKELDVKKATFCKSIGHRKMSHIAIRVIYCESAAHSFTSGQHPPVQHFIVVGGGRDSVCKWIISTTGNILLEESMPTLEAAVDFLSVDEGGGCVVTFERKKVVLRDEGLNVLMVLRCGKERPTDGQFVYSLNLDDSSKPLYYICCFESGIVAAWDLNTDPGGNLSESFDVEALFRIKLSGTTSAATSVCSLVQVDSVVVPAPNRRQAGSEESRRFCVSSRDGKMWVIEWSLLNLTCCNEINCVDLQKQMRFKNDSLQSQGGLAVSEQEGEKGGHKSYKLDGVATALTAASIATTAVRVETVFSVLAMSASGGKNVTSASSGTPRTAVFIITSNGVLITVDVESLKVLGQVVVSEGGRNVGASSQTGGSGSPVLLASITPLSASTATLGPSAGRDPGRGSSGVVLASVMVVVLTAFDRKLYMSPGCITCQSPPSSDKTPVKSKRVGVHVTAETTREVNPRIPSWALRAQSDSRLIVSAATPSEGCTDGEQEQDEGANTDANTALSFFKTSRSPLPTCSPLRAGLSPVDPPPTTGRYADSASSGSRALRGGSLAQGKGSWEKPAKGKDGALVDLPVTFHTRIKSSGYNTASGKTHQLGRSLSAPRNGKRVVAKTTDRTNVNSRIRSYPKSCAPFTVHQPHNDYPVKEANTPFTPVISVSFSGDGSMLGLVTGGNAVTTLKTPLGRFKGDGNFYMGHDSQVNSVEFSHKNQLIVSSSDDGTARVWRPGKVDCAAVVFSHKLHHANVGGPSPLKKSFSEGKVASRAASLTASRNKPLAGPVTRASFYYLDRFVVLTMKSSVLMYTYNLHDFEAKNDLKRLQATGKYKLIHEWSPRGSGVDGTQQAQSITTSACVNSVESPIMIAATSDRKILVLDSVTGGISRNIESGHDRSIHCVALPQPSVHLSLPPTDYNIFATAATDSVITLWDLRTPRSINRLTSHVNRREKCQCAFSPCLRFLATGSEDRSARIFDIRGGKEIAKLSGPHRDVVSSVAYHPIHPQLAVGSYDGGVKCYVGDELS